MADVVHIPDEAETRARWGGFAWSDDNKAKVKEIIARYPKGREHSAILNLDALGHHTLKSFDGSYDLFGNPIFREGELLAESVYRFKGQSAPAVIFTEIDFETLDDKSFRKLFVGMTRARLKLVLVMSERSARFLIDKLIAREGTIHVLVRKNSVAKLDALRPRWGADAKRVGR